MLPEKSQSLSNILTQAIKTATTYGIPSLNVKLLLSEVTGISVNALILHKDLQLNPKQIDTFQSYFKQLLLYKPIQYIIATAEFYGLKLKVNEFVLIPRPETEGLVEWIVKENKGMAQVLDIGTGSGAIALALKKLNPLYKVTALDISSEALRLASFNASKNSVKVTFTQANVYPKSKAKYDIIVSNPPYISTQDYYSLDKEVLCNEPKLALHAGKDGLHYYRKIITRAKKHLQPKGKIYLEIGETQADAIISIAKQTGFQACILKQDLAGKDRYLCIF
jgi:release factor glutamine methyltransferase